MKKSLPSRAISAAISIAALAALFVFSSGFAIAKEIAIGGYKYPTIILIPIISIIICSLIILILLVRVVKSKRREARKKGEYVSIVPFFPRKAKEEKRKENVYLREIKRFKRELPRITAEEAFDLLSDTTKNFFKELLGLHYEFTYNELAQELRQKRKKKELVDICEKFSNLKYSGRKISKEELGNFASEIEKLIRRESRRKEEEELGVSKALTKERKGILGRVASLREKELRKEERKRHIVELMKEEEEALKKDMEIAKNIYHRILSSYYKLPADERKEVYERLMNFYKEINHMLFSSFYGKRSRKEIEYFAKRLDKLKKEAETAEKLAREKPSEKVEKAVGKLRVPELKIKKAESRERGAELKRKRKKEEEDLEKLEEVEKEAKERIRKISESVVRERMEKPLAEPEAKEERIRIREIKPTPIIRREARIEPVGRIEVMPHRIKHAEPVPHEIHRVERIEKPSIKAETKVKKEKEKIRLPKITGLEKVKARSKKLGILEKEEKEIRERLDKLRRYIG